MAASAHSVSDVKMKTRLVSIRRTAVGIACSIPAAPDTLLGRRIGSGSTGATMTADDVAGDDDDRRR